MMRAATSCALRSTLGSDRRPLTMGEGAGVAPGLVRILTDCQRIGYGARSPDENRCVDLPSVPLIAKVVNANAFSTRVDRAQPPPSSRSVAARRTRQRLPAPAPVPRTAQAARPQLHSRNESRRSERPLLPPLARRAGGGAGGRRCAGWRANPQPYNRVVTAQAQTKVGMFKVHQIGERVLFEIPRREMNKDILLAPGNRADGARRRL